MHKDIGKIQTQNCTLDPARAQSLHHTLALDGPAPRAGEALPPFWHQIYFWDTQPPKSLGRDGHPKTGGFIPDFGLPRRMWAGGDLEFHTPLIVGIPATKTTMIETITHKSGRTGPLAFITLLHSITQSGTLCVTERQHLVYRQDPDKTKPTPPPPKARVDETHCQTHRFNSTLLFRYSALTNNGHRIHYDLNYAKHVEGYSGLVTHGPLLAQLMMHMAQDHLGPLTTFTFRAVSPLIHNESADICMNGHDLWVRGADGQICMQSSIDRKLIVR